MIGRYQASQSLPVNSSPNSFHFNSRSQASLEDKVKTVAAPSRNCARSDDIYAEQVTRDPKVDACKVSYLPPDFMFSPCSSHQCVPPCTRLGVDFCVSVFRLNFFSRVLCHWVRHIKSSSEQNASPFNPPITNPSNFLYLPHLPHLQRFKSPTDLKLFIYHILFTITQQVLHDGR